jgi:hypothetical protein
MIFVVDSSEGERVYTENYMAKLAKSAYPLQGLHQIGKGG